MADHRIQNHNVDVGEGPEGSPSDMAQRETPSTEKVIELTPSSVFRKQHLLSAYPCGPDSGPLSQTARGRRSSCSEGYSKGEGMENFSDHEK